jgi:hypothetical protein
MSTFSYTRSGVKAEITPQLLGLQKIRMARGYLGRPQENIRRRRGALGHEVTARHCAISALFGITGSRKILSRMNPLNEIAVSPTFPTQKK